MRKESRQGSNLKNLRNFYLQNPSVCYRFHCAIVNQKESAYHPESMIRHKTMMRYDTRCEWVGFPFVRFAFDVHVRECVQAFHAIMPSIESASIP